MQRFRRIRVFSLLLLLVLFVSVTKAQEVDIKNLNQSIPMNPKVKIGTLPNGLKYYIQKNAKPEKRVELRLVVNAGSLQEDDDQLGIAHFVEHMCFNGTKNFKKNELVSYLQSVGVKFGAHLNAYTSFDETVYILPIPSDKPDILDKGFQILEDWAHNVSFEGEEIDKERGVVIEEWRTGLGAQQRIRDKTFPVIFKGSRYAERLPIGKVEILQNFKHDAARRFYRDWYRPDLMAVMVVGDVDPVEMEAKIKEHFSRLVPVEKPRERKNSEIPDHKETLVVTATDKEANSTQMQIIFKQPAERTLTYADARRDLLYFLFSGMFNLRLREISQKADPPYNFASANYGGFLRTKNAYTLFSSTSEKKVELALKTILAENKRVIDNGFTAGELENYKKQLLNFYESDYNDRDKTESGRYIGGYVQSFLSGDPSSSIEWDYEFVSKVLPTIKVEEINPLIKKWVKDENLVISITGPEKDELKAVTETSIRNLIKEASELKTEAYAFKEIAQPLMANAPTAGKVTKETNIESLGAVEYVLSNGVKVAIKTTDFKNDEIRMSAFSFGGTSLVEEADDFSAQFASQIVNSSGLANFSPIDLQKVLSGKNVFVSPYINRNSEGFFGSSSPKDFETMLQLTNLYFTAPRKSKEDFDSLMVKFKAILANLFANPESFYSRQLGVLLAQDNARAKALAGFFFFFLEKINLDSVYKIYQDRFADASDFNFIFVGNIDPKTAKPLLETYLGSLPAKNRNESYKDLGIRPPKGVIEKEVKKGKDPKSIVTMIFANDLADKKDERFIRSLAQGLSIKLIENLREEKGGVYGTSANAGIEKYPHPSASISIRFTCSPDNVQKLITAAYEEIKKVQENGFSPEDLNKIKEAQRRDLERNQKENFYWVNLLQSVYQDKEDPQELTQANFSKKIEELSSEKLKETAQKYMKLDNRVIFTMNPEE